MLRPLRFACLRALAVATSLSIASAPATAQRAAQVRPLAYTRFVLPNGLIAILNEDHATPIVAVDVWYKFGMRDEKPGQLGTAHFCEHLAGEGTPNLDEPQSTFYKSLGGISQRFGSTIEDITHYNVAVPSNLLETVLWVEGDRMAAPFTRADSAHVARIRPVMEQERLTTVENRLFGVSRELIPTALFPELHPYSIASASRMPDVAKLTATGMKAACAPYYVPNNAVIALSGDLTTSTARAWIEKYFGGIPRGAAVNRVAVPVVHLEREKRLVLEDTRAKQPTIQFDWIGAGYDNPDRHALQAIASALSLSMFGFDSHYTANGVQPPMVGRLSKLLVQDRQLATLVIALNIDLEKSGIFEIVVTPRPGASLTLIETLVDSVVADLRKTPITRAELARYNAYNSVLAVTSLQPRLLRADTLAHDEIFAGDPASYARQANAAQKLTPADVDRVARKYLGAGRVVMNSIPAGRLDLISKPSLPYTNVTPSPSQRVVP